MHSFNHESIQHLLLARHHGLWCTEVGTVYEAPALQEIAVCWDNKWLVDYVFRSDLDSKDQGLEEERVSPLRFLETVGFETLERWVEFWQIEAEGGGNDTETQRWENSRCVRECLTEAGQLRKKGWRVERSRFSRALNSQLNI